MGEKLKDNLIMAGIVAVALVAFPWLALNVNPWLLFLVFPVVLGLYKWRGDSFWLTILMGGAIGGYYLIDIDFGYCGPDGIGLKMSFWFYCWLWLYVFMTKEQKEAQKNRILGNNVQGWFFVILFFINLLGFAASSYYTCIKCSDRELKIYLTTTFVWGYFFVWALVQYCQYRKVWWKRVGFYILVFLAIWGMFGAWRGYVSYQKGCPAIPVASVTQSETGNNSEAGAR